MSDEIMASEADTETAAVETQETKTFTQDELDRIVADRVAREQRKFDKKIQGIDLDDAKDLMAQREAAAKTTTFAFVLGFFKFYFI